MHWPLGTISRYKRVQPLDSLVGVGLVASHGFDLVALPNIGNASLKERLRLSAAITLVTDSLSCRPFVSCLVA